MANPWLRVIGIGEDGLSGLSPAASAALAQAEIVFGGTRHLALADVGARGRSWPSPFSIEPVLSERGRQVAVLASGDPFWHGVGVQLASRLDPAEWTCFPAPSTFSIVAARLGWALEDTFCHGLHATPFGALLPNLANGTRAIALVRDGTAACELAGWVTARGFGASTLWVMEALGGPRERIRATRADAFSFTDVVAPVAVAMLLSGSGGLPRASGLADELFIHDGQITKRPVRALTLSALEPRRNALLWDVGAGSGSVAVEWCLAGGRALAFEKRADRIRHIHANVEAFGLGSRLTIVDGEAPAVLAGQPQPDAVFVGGGGDATILDAVWTALPRGGRLVANAVTLDTEALLLAAHARHGGDLLHIALAQAAPLASHQAWLPSRPIVQWSAVKCA